MNQQNYQSEAKQRWGTTDAYKEHAAKTAGYNREQWQQANDGMQTILAQFARCMQDGHASDSAQAQSLVQSLQTYITEHFYTCTKEILAGLGNMYVADQRFRDNIDAHGEGTAAFLSQTIEKYCE